jgi:hypothetical protein
MGNHQMQPDPNCLLESEALRLAQQGNAAAFEFLYRRHRKRVYCLCLRIPRLPRPIYVHDLASSS